MQTITISQAHYSDLQMSIAKLLKQVDDLKKQLANTLEIGSHLASNLQQQRDENERLRAKQLVITQDEVDLLKNVRLRLEQLEKENERLLKLNNERIVLKNKLEQLEKPRYIAIATIDDWHYDGKHFPNCKCTANGTTIEEVFYNALEYFGERYKLTDVPAEPRIGENFFYANNREVNVFIVKC